MRACFLQIHVEGECCCGSRGQGPLCSGLLGRTISPVAAGGEAEEVGTRQTLRFRRPISDVRYLGSGFWVLGSGLWVMGSPRCVGLCFAEVGVAAQLPARASASQTLELLAFLEEDSQLLESVVRYPMSDIWILDSEL